MAAALLATAWTSRVMTAASQVPAPQPAVSLAPGEAPSPAKEDADLGTPVTSPLVLKRCGTCHEADDKSRLTRISYRRTTPEGWESTIRRMVALNGVRLDPAEGREILRYLADHHGLAPEEAAPGAFEVERRLVDYKYEADKDTEDTCIRCHSFGRVLLQRRTANEWTLLMAMHRGFYPYVDFQAFRRMRPAEREPGPDGREPDNRHPMDKAVAHLTRAFPMQTGEWASWAATMRPPDLAGTWVLSGRQPGKGPVYGIVSVTAGAGPGEFASESRLTFAQTGQSEIRKGRSYVYTGFQWRGRSSREGADAQAMREVMAVDRSWNTMNGRWFGGAYDELGIDVTLTRASAGAVVAGVWPRMLKTGQNGQEVKLFGAGLPARLAAGQLNLGQGVTVARVVSAAPTLATIQVDVAADARVGARDLFLSGGTSRATLSVFDTVDSIRVVPQWNMARLGGGENPSFQKGYAQFEAVASSNGLDGQPGTPDDVELGVVDARWSLEEFSATYDDDDIDFVGTIDPETGLFTPNVDGPNPKRRGNTNNFGDVWVVATYAAPGAPATERPLRARAHLLVTVPLYMDWDTPGVVP